jgi:hypothetical protein
MDPNARRSRGRNAEADAYWRRRFFTLVAGLGVLGLLAWACTGAVGGKAAHQAGGSGQSGNESVAAYGSVAPGQPAGAPGQPAGVAGSPTSLPSAQASVSLPASPTPSATASAQAPQAGKNAVPSQQATSKTAAGDGCPARDIVLTLAVSKTVYPAGALPSFQIDIVSTNPAPCAFNAGRTALRVLITGASRATWDSGACLRGATAHVEHLQRGVPSVASIGWDRRLRPAGCTTPEVIAPAGRYQVMAESGSVVSPAKTFVLR